MASIENSNPGNPAGVGLNDDSSTRETFRTPGSAQDPAEPYEALFCNISSAARGLMVLIDDLDEGGEFKHARLLHKLVGHIGWMAELGYVRMSQADGPRDDGEASRWLLNAYQAKLLGLAYTEDE